MRFRISSFRYSIVKLAVAFIIVFGLLTVALGGQDQKISEKLAALERIQGSFSFVVLGDNRSGDDEYRKLVNMAMERKPAFVVNTGDMVPTHGSLKYWTRFWDLSKPVTAPYFLTVGNHDVHNSGSEKMYREQVDLPGNELYYSFVAGNSLFIVLDSYLTGEEKKITGEQYKWLEGIIGGSTASHKFVFLHHPLYPDKDKGRHYGSSLDEYPRDRDRLQALLAAHRVTMVFSGHDHLYVKKVVDGIPHVITGGGGAPLYAKEKDGGFHHYVYVTVDGDRGTAEVVDIDGKTRDGFNYSEGWK